jgi:aspartate/methionine/tyrosine aminotransferase
MEASMPLVRRPARLHDIAALGVDRMGSIADARPGLLRLENLDVDILPDAAAVERTRAEASSDAANSYLPFIGQIELRRAACRHVTRTTGVAYDPERHCVVSAGGLSGILNVLLTTVDVGDEVIVTDPTYVGLLNRIRLAGGVPVQVPMHFRPGEEWRLDTQALAEAVTPRTRAMLLMSPSMPSGAVFSAADWVTVAELCVRHNLLLIVDAAMERLLFDRRFVVHPAGLPGMAERTFTIGSCAKELRMIGWRVGWVVGPEAFMPDLVAVSLANVVVPVGIAQQAVALALERSEADMPRYVAELEARRDLMASELRGLPYGLPAGGWSMLLRVNDFGIDGPEMSRRLLAQGVAATPMNGWGRAHGRQYIRFVFSNEPRERLRGVGEKVRRALGA